MESGDVAFRSVGSRQCHGILLIMMMMLVDGWWTVSVFLMNLNGLYIIYYMNGLLPNKVRVRVPGKQ